MRIPLLASSFAKNCTSSKETPLPDLLVISIPVSPSSPKIPFHSVLSQSKTKAFFVLPKTERTMGEINKE